MSRLDQFTKIREIADAISDGSATREDYQKLETLIKDSEEAMTFYRDYMLLDGEMKAEHKPDLEVIMRRMQVDELIIRPKGETQIQSKAPEPPLLLNSPEKPQKNKSFLIIVTLLLLCLFTIIYFSYQPEEHRAQLLSGQVKSDLGGIQNSGWLKNTDYIVQNQANLKALSGFEYTLFPDSVFNFKTESDIFLNVGKLKLLPASDASFNIETPAYFLEGPSCQLEIELPKNQEMSIETDNTPVFLTPKRWRPKHYWNFDQHSDRSQDLVGTADGVVHPTVQPTKGLVGTGAYQFNNSSAQIINLGSGGGTALATGSFAVHDGISIEAVIHSSWNGEDYDEIFRKDKDGQLRIILSFQNDWDRANNNLSVPKVEPGPVLSFGLYLVGEGYHELELPFNGKNKQLSLKELRGKPHHIVATYDCTSGIKAIFINGKMMAFHQYKPGTRVLSGGPGSASIGNHPVSLQEAFSGIIDEVAFYDFALPPLTIQLHYDAIQNGQNYFGQKPSQQRLNELKYEIKLPVNSKVDLDPLTGLPNSISKK